MTATLLPSRPHFALSVARCNMIELRVWKSRLYQLDETQYRTLVEFHMRRFWEISAAELEREYLRIVGAVYTPEVETQDDDVEEPQVTGGDSEEQREDAPRKISDADLKALAVNGSTVNGIAERLGLTPRTIRDRLRILGCVIAAGVIIQNDNDGSQTCQ